MLRPLTNRPFQDGRFLHTKIFQFREVLRLDKSPAFLGTLALWAFKREYVVLIRDLDAPLPPVPPHEHLEWTPLREVHVQQLLRMNPLFSAMELNRRLLDGQECLLCWFGDDLVHYRWETTESIFLPYLGTRLKLLEHDSLVTEVFTHPAFRGVGIDSVGSIMALHKAKKKGCKRSIALVATWNKPSLRTSGEKTGRKVVGKVGYWAMGKNRYFVTGHVQLDEYGNVYVPENVFSRGPL